MITTMINVRRATKIDTSVAINIPANAELSVKEYYCPFIAKKTTKSTASQSQT